MTSPADRLDAHRTRVYIGAGIEPEKAMALTAVLRHAEDTTSDFVELARKREALHQVLHEQGVPLWEAFTSLYCNPPNAEAVHPIIDTKETEHAQDA